MKKTIGLSLVAALSLTISATACSKKKKDAPKDKPAPTADDKNPAPAARPAAPAAGGTTAPVAGGSAGVTMDALASLPGESKAVFGINMKAAKASPFFDKVKAMAMAKDSNGDFKKFVEDCKFDPTTQLDWIVFGMDKLGKGADNEPTLVAKGAFDEPTLMECAAKKAAEKNEPMKTEDYKGHKLYTSGKDPNKIITFTAKDTAVMGDRKWVTSLLDGGAATAKSGPIATNVGKVDTTQAIWFVINEMPAGGMGPMAQMPMGAPKAMWGSLDLTSGIAAHLWMQLDSADTAKMMADMGKAQASSPMIKQMFSKLELEATGDIAHIELGMTEDQVNKMVGMIGMMGARMGGGGMGGMGGPPPGP